MRIRISEQVFSDQQIHIVRLDEYTLCDEDGLTLPVTVFSLDDNRSRFAIQFDFLHHTEEVFLNLLSDAFHEYVNYEEDYVKTVVKMGHEFYVKMKEKLDNSNGNME